MRQNRKFKKAVSGILAAMTLFTSVAVPIPSFAADDAAKEDLKAYVTSLPELEEVKDQLSKDEIVIFEEAEYTAGEEIDMAKDLTGIYYDKEKVKVKFYKAVSEEGNDFDANKAGTYKATYYAEPASGNPAYKFTRKIIVKEKAVEKSTKSVSTQSTAGTDKSADKDKGESEDADADSAADVAALKAKEEAELDAEIEKAEEQDTYDEKTGLSLSDVMTYVVENEQEALNDLEEGETVTITMEAPMQTVSSKAMLAAASTETVDVTMGTRYNYADYGLGSFYTHKYTVKFGDVSATAYCVQPSRGVPGDGKYTVTKLKDGKALAKVCYYGTKAAGDEGFFAEKHPDFSAGKRFVITHVAAAYANGSSDAFSGVNSTGKELALELYNYCMDMPNIPDVDMEFSDNDVKAYVDGNNQRTKEITFKADELQTITFKLPDGVKLHNVTTDKTSKAGADVEINGGTKFYLIAPLSQAGDMKETWSTTMKGSVTKDFSAYKITTTSTTQDLAFVFGEGVDDEKYVDFKVTWLKDCTVKIIKKDNVTGNTLEGAVYGIYSDKDCTKLIKKMPATDANGASEVTFEKDNDTVYIKEITTRAGYAIDTSAYNVKVEIGDTTTKNVTDKRVNATIQLVKEDSETGGTPQGDATLEGAVYGLYAKEAITHPDGKTGTVYKKDAQVATLKTDKAGKASVSNLYLGKYYVKEITPPEGYLIDKDAHDVTCDYEGQTVETVKRTVTSKEDVIKQPFQVIKAANNGETDADLLKGVGFSAYLESTLTKKADGSYDFSKAKPVVITESGKTEMFTDEKGYAVSIPLPYGKYIVRETTTPHNFTPVDDFRVIIKENHPNDPQVWRVLLDDEFKAKLKIIKKDDETMKPVLLANTEFKVYDKDNQKYIEQVTTYPSTVVHKSYFTDDSGSLILPRNLKPGNYRVEEVTAPDGYTLNKQAVDIQVDTNTAYQVDSVSGDAIIEVDVKNHPVKGELTIHKEGEVLTKYEDDFSYELSSLAGAEFAVYANEDIYTPDHQVDKDGNRIVVYEKDVKVADAVTDAEGKAVIGDLPLGTYRIEETKAPEGFVRNTEPQIVTFSYQDQDTPVISQEATFTNDRQKVSLAVEKQDAETNAVVAGAVFALYNKEAIIAGETTLVEADTLLQEITSDENGLAVFTLDLPLGQYYVKETKAPDGYVSSDEVLEFDASYQGQDIPVVELKSIKKNEPTTFEFTKSDITTGVELEGATLTILDRSGNVIDRWTSSKDEPHVVKCLTVGESYVLREEMAPYGYLKAEEVTFTVADTAEVQKVEMKDEVPTALLIINKKGEFLDKVTLLDKAKGTVEKVFEYITGELTVVTFDVYAAEDIKAADGVSPDYYKKDELVGTIKTDDKGVATLGDLPAGKYYVKEQETAHGYVLDGEPRYVDLSYRDQDTPIIVYDENWQNVRQKAIVKVKKVEKGTETPLAGGVFGLFAGADIKSASGKVLIEKDEIIELKTTDKNGGITFAADLPVDGEYYVKEEYAPDGYVTTNEKKSFVFEYGEAAKAEITYDFTFENEPTNVEITKSDITNGKELPGARLKVTDEKGKTVDEWTSTDKPHLIQKLTVGKEYTLTETKPADGYVTAESIKFKIENTGEVQKVEMKDDVTKVKISKQDITNSKEIPGAKLTIFDKNGKKVESWTSGKKPHYIEKLPIGKYTLREETAPDGYTVAEDVKFTVKDTGEIQTVVMKDAPKKQPQKNSTPSDGGSGSSQKIRSTPQTGDDSNPGLWIIVMLAALGALGTSIWSYKRKLM